MIPIILIIHVVFCIALILIVLVQKGKGAGMGAAFGGSSQTVFGSAGATTLLHKITTVVAIVFMLTSLGLSFFIGRGGPSSIMEDVTPTTQTQQTTEAPGSAPSHTGGTQETK